MQYLFPKSYLSRVRQMGSDWVVYRDLVKIPHFEGFFAVAEVEM